MKPHKTPKVAVIGQFFNAGRKVEGWLNQLACQTYTEFLVYVVDDGSTDNTARRLKEVSEILALPIYILSLEKNYGRVAARNAGLKAAMRDGVEIFLLLDSDTRVAPDWVAQHVAFHEKTTVFGILGGAIKGQAQTAMGIADGYCAWEKVVPFSCTGEVLHDLSALNWSMKRRVIERVGYFGENLTTGEDTVYCVSAREAGERLFFRSDLIVQHLDQEERHSAARHHYRWGLHAYFVSTLGSGNYYHIFKGWNQRRVALMVPLIALISVIFLLFKYTRYQKRVWLYLPWIAYLKFWNALGVYHGFVNPMLCQRPERINDKSSTSVKTEEKIVRAAV